MVGGDPNWGLILGAFVILWVILSNTDSGGTSRNQGNYNRGVLQQTSHKKLKTYVVKEWERRGYITDISHADGEYIDVFAESPERDVAISVRPRQEQNKVSANAIKRFRNAFEALEADHAVMISTSFFTKPAREVAEQSGVELLNGEELADIFTDHSKIPG